MDSYSEYQRFPDLNSASELIDILETNEIPYEIDDSAMRFDIAATANYPLDKQIIIKIKDVDIERVNQLFTSAQSDLDSETSVDHYLYTFSDDDIIDIIANPAEWTDFEVGLAKQISEKRGLKPTAELIKSLRKENFKEKTKNELEAKNKQKSGYGWFLLIAILSMLNSFDFAFNKRLFFIFGLGVTQLIDGIISTLQGNFVYLGFAVNITISSVFILFWYYAKKEKHWAFLAGMILYGLDALLFVFVKDWLSVGFHIFGLIGISLGYNTFLEKKKNETFV